MATQTRPQINIKGIREGLLISLGDGAYDDMLSQLAAELTQKQEFLRGSRITLAVAQRPLRREQLVEIQALFEAHGLTLWTVLAEKEMTRALARELGLATRLPGSYTDLEGNALSPAASPPETAETKKNEPSCLLLKETLRSGRSVYHEGHVVIVGDVNPGAQVVAGGDVIVWGRLRGLVHAGALGDETAVICALDLSPTQLRIASQIAIPPDERQGKPIPEQAAVRGSQIVAEPWSTRN